MLCENRKSGLSRVRLCRPWNGRSLAGLQQFFTGKLYVLVQQLKLPAEELLWSALSCPGDPSPERRDKTARGSSVLGPARRCAAALLLVWRVHVLTLKP